MRRALLIFLAVAIVVVGCAKAPTPDKAYLAYLEEVAGNEKRAYEDILYTIQSSSLENPMAPCLWADDLQNATEKLAGAVERAPRPSHKSLKEHQAYLLQGMEYQLLAIRYLDRACATMDADEMYMAVLTQDEVARLVRYANDALDDYERSH